MTPKDKEIENFVTICEGAKAEHGTLRVKFNYVYEVRKQILKLDGMGVPRLVIEQILNQYE